jgi:hypothetical protein
VPVGNAAVPLGADVCSEALAKAFESGYKNVLTLVGGLVTALVVA